MQTTPRVTLTGFKVSVSIWKCYSRKISNFSNLQCKDQGKIPKGRNFHRRNRKGKWRHWNHLCFFWGNSNRPFAKLLDYSTYSTYHRDVLDQTDSDLHKTSIFEIVDIFGDLDIMKDFGAEEQWDECAPSENCE